MEVNHAVAQNKWLEKASTSISMVILALVGEASPLCTSSKARKPSLRCFSPPPVSWDLGLIAPVFVAELALQIAFLTQDDAVMQERQAHYQEQ
jgi:hypothetical protein